MLSMSINPSMNSIPYLDYMNSKDRQSRIAQAIVDIKSGPHTHDWIVQVLGNYGFTEASLSAAECQYVNKMINS